MVGRKWALQNTKFFERKFNCQMSDTTLEAQARAMDVPAATVAGIVAGSCMWLFMAGCSMCHFSWHAHYGARYSARATLAMQNKKKSTIPPRSGLLPWMDSRTVLSSITGESPVSRMLRLLVGAFRFRMTCSENIQFFLNQP